MMPSFTLEEFNRCAQIQADFLYERGCRKPKEMVINEDLRKSLNLGSSITLNHMGEIPLVDDPHTVLFMFRGFTYDPTKDNSLVITVEKTSAVGPSEEIPVIIEKSLSLGTTEHLRATKVPMSQRKRAAR